ncbi:MAG: transporter substrate-binding domain-containing protein [Betaproteobacteria bacterium]|nr:transporter substrate-binding domain-containing protein [Betaproteobacteria bacterium]
MTLRIFSARLSKLLGSLYLSAAVFMLPVAAKADALADVKSRKELRVGLDPGFIPFEMKTPKGEMIGFDIDMISAFAASLGAKASFVDTRWEGIIPALMAKKFDLIVSGMTITEERKRTVLFSDPYYTAGLQALVSSKKKDVVKTVADLNRVGLNIAVKVGTTGDHHVGKSFPKATLRKLDSESDCANAVALGKVDVFIYDKPYLELFASRNSNKVYLLKENLTVEDFGVAARKSETALISSFNAFLKSWKASGAYERSIKTHFVDMPWASSLPLFK